MTRDHFLIMHKLETAKQITLVYIWVGGLRSSFIFELINAENRKVKCKLSGNKKETSGAVTVCRKSVFITSNSEVVLLLRCSALF